MSWNEHTVRFGEIDERNLDELVLLIEGNRKIRKNTMDFIKNPLTNESVETILIEESRRQDDSSDYIWLRVNRRQRLPSDELPSDNYVVDFYVGSSSEEIARNIAELIYRYKTEIESKSPQDR